MPTTAAEMMGGCLCRAVRYRLLATPVDAGWCHCRNCQLNSGSPAIIYYASHIPWAEAADDLPRHEGRRL